MSVEREHTEALCPRCGLYEVVRDEGDERFCCPGEDCDFEFDKGSDDAEHVEFARRAVDAGTVDLGLSNAELKHVERHRERVAEDRERERLAEQERLVPAVEPKRKRGRRSG